LIHFIPTEMILSAFLKMSLCAEVMIALSYNKKSLSSLCSEWTTSWMCSLTIFCV